MRKSLYPVKKWHFPALAFAIPFLGILIIMAIGQYSPFGQYSMLYSDMYHQYFPFFVSFRRALLSGESLLFNWDVGLGLDYLGLYSYYLASPLNWFSILIPEQWLLGYFSLLTPIKLGLASMFFCIFLNGISPKEDIASILFGCFYGLCAWALGYQWNIMWLDTFAILPLVMLGMIRLLKEKKFVLYTITLFLSVYTNYYIGLFTCIFIFLTFICYEICRWKNLSSFIGDLLRIAVFSALAIGLTAIISLPTLAALKTTQSSVNKFPEGFQLNMTTEDNWKGLLLTMAHVAGNTNGGIEPTYKEGLPNLYCGLFATILSFMYLLSKDVKIRDKICAVCLLLFLNVSFIIRQLDYIWHGFHFTNMIPYRFSFLYSFVALYIGYIAWNNRKNFRLGQIVISSLATLGIILCYKDIKDIVFWVYNGILLLLYGSVLIYYCTLKTKQRVSEDGLIPIADNKATRRICSFVFVGIIATELVMNLVNFGLSFPATNASNYPKGKEDSAAVIDYMQALEKDTPFYRAEVTHTQTLNDGALNGYHGITTFTSSANVNVTKFMQALGYGAKDTYNRYSFEESSPVANLFLNLKYMIERDGKIEDNAYFDDIYSAGNIHLLKNNAYLPLGFLCNSQLLNVDFDINADHFALQNNLIRQAAGLYADVWSPLNENSLIIKGTGVDITPQPSTGYCAYVSPSNDTGTVVYSYTVNKAGFVCIDLDLSKRNNYSVYLNNVLLYSETHSLPQMISVSDALPGDVIQIKVKCNKNEKGSIKIQAAVLNETLFRKAYNNLSASVLDITSFENTEINGTITCKNDGVLYTSIPQNGNWKAIVDGKPAEIVTIGNAMVGLLLSKGDHTVQFVYQNRAFAFGWKISLASLLIFIGFVIAAYKPILLSKISKKK